MVSSRALSYQLSAISFQLFDLPLHFRTASTRVIKNCNINLLTAHFNLAFASTTAPTMATSKRTLVISKGKR
jgi:hypothetical protein